MDSYSVEIFKLKLESENIPVLVWDARDSSYNAFGYVHLQVQKTDVEQAKLILDIKA